MLGIYDDVEEFVVILRHDDGTVVLSRKIDRVWDESVMSEDDIQRLRDMLDGKTDNSGNLINLSWG